MKAMILAAGLGTRLRPLTENRPKALVEIRGRTLLEIVLARLRVFGIREVIINVHHFAGMIADYLKVRNYFGMRVELSHEEVLLDTGGGLKKAAHFFVDDCSQPGEGEPFLLHNVDVVSTIDLQRMLQCHVETHALGTLAVHRRASSRYLLFDQHLRLCGWRSLEKQQTEIVSASRQELALAFAGIHVLSPAVFAKMDETGAFSIISSYLRLAAKGEKILAFPADEYYWRDLGRPEHVQQIQQDLATGGFSLP